MDANEYMPIAEMERIEAEETAFPLVDHRGSRLVVRMMRHGQIWTMPRAHRCAALREFHSIRRVAPLSAGLSLPADDWRGFAPRDAGHLKPSADGIPFCFVLAHPQDSGEVI